jgi:hypothetical protein
VGSATWLLDLPALVLMATAMLIGVGWAVRYLAGVVAEHWRRQRDDRAVFLRAQAVSRRRPALEPLPPNERRIAQVELEHLPRRRR